MAFFEVLIAASIGAALAAISTATQVRRRHLAATQKLIDDVAALRSAVASSSSAKAKAETPDVSEQMGQMREQFADLLREIKSMPPTVVVERPSPDPQRLIPSARLDVDYADPEVLAALRRGMGHLAENEALVTSLNIYLKAMEKLHRTHRFRWFRAHRGSDLILRQLATTSAFEAWVRLRETSEADSSKD